MVPIQYVFYFVMQTNTALQQSSEHARGEWHISKSTIEYSNTQKSICIKLYIINIIDI